MCLWGISEGVVFSQVPATEHKVKINLSLDDDIIGNLVLTHQACEPTTHTSTEKVAIIKEKMSQKPVKCYTLTRHPTSRIWQRDVEIQDGKKKKIHRVWRYLMATLDNLLHVLQTFIIYANVTVTFALIGLFAQWLKWIMEDRFLYDEFYFTMSTTDLWD